MATKNSVPVPYTPGPPSFSERAIWDEFHAIAQALGALDRPMAMAASCSDVLAAGPAASNPAWELLFDEGLAIAWSAPEGLLAGGIFTVPAEGLWSFDVVLTVNPFNSPGQRSYAAELRSTWTHASGVIGPTVETIRSGGLDDQYVSVVNAYLLPALRGDTVRFDARCIQEFTTGSVACGAKMNAQRVSGIR